ncbi:ABC transporter permease [Streptomyces turgidiscabies]|uniref:Amino acid or sugar ABC transporter, permease protein n=1 Tax=Streptomyces turgidiscabies (strain Car8) TaxID=698760 RepID=L7FJ39_STRT8|nr:MULTISPECIES: ABC transporter permease [Streptomyces]ELP71352.1 amino acid or sugar ABC transporter, permease protein [Streptomyces turgidiscabies Car8]MDX3493743.1 ABC transporter permease [Streptomyces turgidiscabies]GAQ71663.1 ribose transport system permease protein RbsC [Streptomyces turgidiscabies]
MTTTQSAAPAKTATPSTLAAAGPRIQNAVIKYGFVFVTVTLFTYFALSEPSFRDSATLLDTLRYVSVAAILGLGVTLTMAVGGMDMSVGAVAGLGVTVAAKTMVSYNQVGVVAIIAVIVAGALAGLLNALLIVVLKIPDMLATLGTMFVIQGTKLILVDGQSITPGMTRSDGTTAPGRFTEGFLRIDRGTILGIPVSVVIFGALTVVAWVFLARTRWGRVLYAIGANPEASRLAGIRVGAYRGLAYVLSGVLASIGGLILAARIGQGDVSAGTSQLLEAVAVALVGTSVLGRGRPNVWGTALGAVLIGIITTGLTIKGLPYYTQDVVEGAVLILALVFSFTLSKRRTA